MPPNPAGRSTPMRSRQQVDSVRLGPLKCRYVAVLCLVGALATAVTPPIRDGRALIAAPDRNPPPKEATELPEWTALHQWIDNRKEVRPDIVRVIPHINMQEEEE